MSKSFKARYDALHPYGIKNIGEEEQFKNRKRGPNLTFADIEKRDDAFRAIIELPIDLIVPPIDDYYDESEIRKVEKFNESYRLVEKGVVLNWFDVTAPEGRLSLNSKMSEIMATFRGKLILMGLFKKLMGGKKGKEKKAAGFTVNKGMMRMMEGFTLLRMTSMVGMMNISFTKEELLKMNAKLNKIKQPKPKKK